MPVIRKDGQNLLFIHVPKTGGSSIETIFRRNGYQVNYLDGKMGPQNLNHVRKCTPQHMHAELLNTTFRLDRFDAIFMAVRHPVARLRSEYLWRNRRNLSISQRDIDTWVQTSFEKYETNPYLYDNHLRPQTEFYVPRCAVYRFEDGIDTMVKDLAGQYGLDTDVEVPQLKHSGTERGVSSGDIEFSPHVRKQIDEFYADDFEFFGYER